MDSEDEHIFEEEKRKRKDGVRLVELIYDLYDSPTEDICPRPYEKEERTLQRNYIQDLLFFESESEDSGPVAKDNMEYIFDIGGHYRLRRLFHSIEGYHKGYLDLRGRFPDRYESLSRRLTQLLKDVADCATRLTGRVRGEDNQDLWLFTADFCSKWHLRVSDQSELLELVRDYAEKGLATSQPKFQVIHLHDLPPEIVSHIMSFADTSALWRLRMTARYFRDISRRYLYETWTLSISPYKRSFPDNDREIESALTRQLEGCFEEVIHVLSRPDLVQTVTRFRALVPRYEDTYEPLGLTADAWDKLYVFPFHSILRDVMRHAPRIESMELCGHILFEDLIRSILSLNSLHSLDLWSNKLSRLSGAIRPNSSILNVVSETSPEDMWTTTWDFLCSCSAIRFVWIDHVNDPFGTTALELSPHHNPFMTLERVVLRDFTPLEVVQIAEAIIQFTSQGHSLRITHFKLHTRLSLFWEDTLILLTALRGSPMEYFVLDGVGYIEPGLFDRIAEAFPQLRSLVVVYRESIRQTKSTDALWPHASWEYAPHLQGFHKLEHFAWNFRHTTVLLPAVPLLFLEDGFPEWWEKEYGGLQGNEDEEWGSVARVLASYCPSLKTVACDSERSIPWHCEISRKANGELQISPRLCNTIDSNGRRYRNPGPIFGVSTWQCRPQVVQT